MSIDCKKQARRNEASAKGRDTPARGTFKSARGPRSKARRGASETEEFKPFATYSALRHCPLRPSRVLLFTLFVALPGRLSAVTCRPSVVKNEGY